MAIRLTNTNAIGTTGLSGRTRFPQSTPLPGGGIPLGGPFIPNNNGMSFNNFDGRLIAATSGTNVINSLDARSLSGNSFNPIGIDPRFNQTGNSFNPIGIDPRFNNPGPFPGGPAPVPIGPIDIGPAPFPFDPRLVDPVPVDPVPTPDPVPSPIDLRPSDPLPPTPDPDPILIVDPPAPDPVSDPRVPPPPPPPPPPPKQDPYDLVPSRSKIFKKFDRGNDVVREGVVINTAGLWQNGSGSLATFVTQSGQSGTDYYYSVWNADPTNCSNGKQFDIAYGHYDGSGSTSIGGQVNDTSTRAIYSQMKLLSLNNVTAETKFTFNGTETDQVYVILFNRSKMKDRVDPGNWELSLSELNGGDHANNFFTGSNVEVSSSNKVISLIDDSGDSDQSLATQNAYLTSKVYNVVSGSISNGTFSTSSVGSFYPDLGMVVIDADYLDSELSFNSVTGSNIAGDNAHKIFKSISGSAVINSDFTFDARNTEAVTNEYFFVRVSPREFNYSNNPTFVTGSLGEFRFTNYENNPITYITTIGLFNNKREMLAVAKSSQPIKNTFNEEHLIRVKLEY